MTEPAKPFSLSVKDAYIIKSYTHKFVDYVEVEFYVPGCLTENGYKAELSADGMAIVWKRAIPDYFCESRRMAKMMGKMKGGGMQKMMRGIGGMMPGGMPPGGGLPPGMRK
mgnify:CR=1 FL=1